MWSQDSVSETTETGKRANATLIEGYQITVPPGYDQLDVAALPGLPGLGEPFPGLPDARAKNRSFRKLSPIYWICTVSYEGEVPSMNTRPIIRWSNQESDEPIDVDRDGNPIVTANGEPINGVTRKINDLVADVQKNYRSISLPATHQYLESTNADVFLGFAPGVCRLTAFDAVEKWDIQDSGYWEVNAKFVFRYPYQTDAAKAWYARVLHEGYYERTLDNKIVRAVDEYKEPVTKPVMLKLNGQRELNPLSATFLEFPRYKPLNYSLLGIVL
jgi:hypothetical protein